MSRWNSRLALVLGLSFFTQVCVATSFYVTDKITIAIYPDADNTTAPLKKIPSGTLVNTLTEGEISTETKFVKIETQDGVTGWIEAKYLTNEKPTQIEYLQLAAKYNAAELKIRDYETRLLELQELRKEVKTVDWLRNQLTENRTREESFEQQIKQKDIALADLKITIARLEDQLSALNPDAATEAKNAGASPRQTFASESEIEPVNYANTSSIRFYTWLVLSLAVTLIIGILLGFVLIDYKARKKSTYVKQY